MPGRCRSPEMEPTLTMAPDPRSTIDLPKAVATANGPVRFKSMVLAHPDTVMSRGSARKRAPPALLTMMSGPPVSSWSWSAVADTCSISVTSQAAVRTTAPSCCMSAAICSRRSADLARRVIEAPCRARACAMAWPISPVAPVTSAERPSRRKGSVFKLWLLRVIRGNSPFPD